MSSFSCTLDGMTNDLRPYEVVPCRSGPPGMLLCARGTELSTRLAGRCNSSEAMQQEALQQHART